MNRHIVKPAIGAVLLLGLCLGVVVYVRASTVTGTAAMAARKAIRAVTLLTDVRTLRVSS
jgi:uncharacterized membrane protein